MIFSIGKKIRDLFRKKDNREIERVLYEADLGVDTIKELMQKVNSSSNIDLLISSIKEELLFVLEKKQDPIPLHHPHVLMMVGTNGSGKTTAIAKLTNYYQKQGKKVLIAAADTYRAAAVDQLNIWAKKLNAPIILSKKGSDPAAVVFDSIQALINRNYDILLIDTAGRLSNKTALMEELRKIKKVCNKLIEGAPHETILTIDATIGQNALSQASVFHSFTPLSNIFLTKYDAQAKGGMIIAIKKELDLDVKWLGTGEKVDDLKVFDPKKFIEGLFS